jgi:hypothetical protein
LTPIQNARAESARKSNYASKESRGSARRSNYASKESRNSSRASHGVREKLIDYMQPDYIKKVSRQVSQTNSPPGKNADFQDTLRSPSKKSLGTIDLKDFSPDKYSILRTGPMISTQRTKRSQMRSPSQLYSLSPESRVHLKSKREQYSTERRRIHYSP